MTEGRGQLTGLEDKLDNPKAQHKSKYSLGVEDHGTGKHKHGQGEKDLAAGRYGQDKPEQEANQDQNGPEDSTM